MATGAEGAFDAAPNSFFKVAARVVERRPRNERAFAAACPNRAAPNPVRPLRRAAALNGTANHRSPARPTPTPNPVGHARTAVAVDSPPPAV